MHTYRVREVEDWFDDSDSDDHVDDNTGEDGHHEQGQRDSDLDLDDEDRAFMIVILSSLYRVSFQILGGEIDIQGIQWERLAITRENYREIRLQQYKNYENIPNSGEAAAEALLMKATMDSIFTTAFGVDLATLSGPDEGRCFAASFDDASEFILLRYVDAFWKVSRFPNVSVEAALRHMIKVVVEFVYKHIRAKAEEMSAGAKAHDAGSKDDLLSRFILATNNDTGKVDYKYLRDIKLNIVMAGKVTTAEALAWFLYMMCKHPEVQEKISKEAADADEATSSIDDFSCSLTHEALNKMHYLHAALTETLRLYPSLPLDNKECFSDNVLPNGFSVGKGDIVFYAPYAMGRMERLWGEDAVVFLPEDGSTSAASSYRRALSSSSPVSVGLSGSSPVTMSSVWSPRRIITTLAHRSLT
ncbi:hypothetical protein D1007_34491 [Hordeum vulgare]|nr:hypothetical protein D1007_34491 [Hordeum vulgare]